VEPHLVDTYRREFPVTDKYIYLDHAGIAPLPKRVVHAVETFLSESAESGAFNYAKWGQQVVDVRRACSRLVNAAPEEIAFVRSTSHGLSLVAHGLDWKPGDNMLVYEREFPSNFFPWLNLREQGVDVRFIPSREGRIFLEDVERLIDEGTRLIAVSSVQFVNGFRLDLEKAGALCRSRNVFFCVDAIQSLGLLPMDVKKYNIDFLSADAHKWLLGPEGIGIFFCKSGLAERLSPALVGWKSVQNAFSFEEPNLQFRTDALRFEEGSMNLMGIAGLGAALELLFEVGIDRVAERVLGLGDVVIREAEKRGYTVLTPGERNMRGGQVTFRGPFDPVIVRDHLRDQRIMVNVRGGGLRVSPHFYNTESELMIFFSRLDELTKRDATNK
jgi:cysteine desulfurase/selenocysteine lyase